MNCVLSLSFYLPVGVCATMLATVASSTLLKNVPELRLQQANCHFHRIPIELGEKRYVRNGFMIYDQSVLM